MAWEIQTNVLSLQANARIKKEEKEESVLCIAEDGSLNLVSGVEAVYTHVRYSLPHQFDLEDSSICTGPGSGVAFPCCEMRIQGLSP